MHRLALSAGVRRDGRRPVRVSSGAETIARGRERGQGEGCPRRRLVQEGDAPAGQVLSPVSFLGFSSLAALAPLGGPAAQMFLSNAFSKKYLEQRLVWDIALVREDFEFFQHPLWQS
jgi:hypothetical protein